MCCVSEKYGAGDKAISGYTSTYSYYPNHEMYMHYDECQHTQIHTLCIALTVIPIVDLICGYTIYSITGISSITVTSLTLGMISENNNNNVINDSIVILIVPK